ncbi:hypothetical protein BDR26DRAFT_852787, partial [Obelidium mucronatum]
MQTKKDRSRPTQVTTSPLVVKAQTALRKWQWSLRKDKPNHFDGTLIPTEVLEQILVWFNPHGIICLRLLCRNVNSIITSNEFARLHLSQAIPSDFDATSTTDLKKLKSHFKWENCLDNYQLVFARDYSAMRNLTVLDSPIWSGSRIPTCLHAFEQLTVLYLNGGRFRENRIPPGLGTLSSLRELALQNCFLGGSIPDELGNLGRLELLNLSQNNIIGSFPSSFQNLKTLKRLCVSSNLMDVSAPHWKFLTSLEELDVSYNNRLRILPKEWSDLLNLKKLTAHHCYLQGEIPEAYGSLSHLESLDLSDNYLSGEIPTTLGNLVHLTFLSLAKNQLVGSIPPELGKCVNLETICLMVKQVERADPPIFGRLLRLSVLEARLQQTSWTYSNKID